MNFICSECSGEMKVSGNSLKCEKCNREAAFKVNNTKKSFKKTIIETNDETKKYEQVLFS